MSKTILRAIFSVASATTRFLLGSEVFAHLIALRVASQAIAQCGFLEGSLAEASA